MLWASEKFFLIIEQSLFVHIEAELLTNYRGLQESRLLILGICPPLQIHFRLMSDQSGTQIPSAVSLAGR